MKQIIRLYTLLVVPCLLLAGCNSDEDVGDWGEPVAVQFGMGEVSRLKTTSGGDQWTLNDPIGVFMIKNGQLLSSANIAEGADNVEYKAQTGGNAVSGFIPVSGTPVFYPQNGDNVDFIAYYPYKSPVTNYTLPIDVGDQGDASKIDVLYSKNAAGYNKNSSTVDLQFSHVLSKLSFTLTPEAGAPPALAGAKIEITNLATTADMNLADGTVTPTNSGQTLTANTSANGLSSSAIVIPQTLSGSKLKITLADNASVFEWDFPANTEFLSGKNHQYTITVSKTGITVSSSGITIWTGTGDPATPGTAETLTQYKVGDYYPDPTNSSTAIGVVFWLDPAAWGYDSSGTPTGYFGKIVGLQEKMSVAWSSVYSITGATNTSNGRENMATIHTLANDFSGYPAFKWIHDEMNGGGTTNYYSNPNAKGVWYLPAIDELWALYQVKATVNTGLTSAGGTVLDGCDYRSSSENDNATAWLINFVGGSTSDFDKIYAYSSIYRARCVLAF